MITDDEAEAVANALVGQPIDSAVRRAYAPAPGANDTAIAYAAMVLLAELGAIDRQALIDAIERGVRSMPDAHCDGAVDMRLRDLLAAMRVLAEEMAQA